MFKTKRRSNRNNRSGATTVEFAIVVPVIFTLFLGTIEMTRLNFIRHSAANAAYEGARKAIIPGSSYTEATDEAMRLMQAVGVSNGVTANLTTLNDTMTVTVTVPVNQNSWGALRFSNGMIVRQSCTLTKETPR